MKIAFIIPTFYPKIGGAQNNCYYIARELTRKHNVSIFCSGKSESKEKIGNIKVYRCREVFRWKYYTAFYPSLKKVLEEKFDIIHIHGLGFIQQDLVIRQIKKYHPETKIVCTPHGPFMALKYGFAGRMFKRLYTPFVKKIVKNCDAVIQVNPFQYKWMEKEYGIPRDKIKLLPNGIPKSLFKQTDKKSKDRIEEKYNLKNKFVVSYVGRIQKYKGVEQVIKVLPKLKEDIVFVAIGKDAGDKRRLKEIAEKLGVEKKVLFTGFVNEKEKLELLELSKIFIFPSEWEAFGIVVLEAMAKGNAIISTKTEGGRYLIGKENGFLFSYGDVNELEGKLKNLILNKEKRERISRDNIEKVKKFRWEKIAGDLERMYLEILK